MSVQLRYVYQNGQMILQYRNTMKYSDYSSIDDDGNPVQLTSYEKWKNVPIVHPLAGTEHD